jgi:hypothetical protein
MSQIRHFGVSLAVEAMYAPCPSDQEETGDGDPNFRPEIFPRRNKVGVPDGTEGKIGNLYNDYSAL